MNRPAHVEQARLNGDKEALSAYGKLGARARIENAAKAAMEDEMLATKRAEEELERKQQANEHIAPID